MNAEHQPRGAGGWLTLAIVGTLLLALAAFVVMRSRPTHSALIKIDSNGTTRLGPLPLRNTNLRDAAFTAVGRLRSSTVLVSVAESAQMSEVVKTLAAMNQAGLTSVTLRLEGIIHIESPNPAPITRDSDPQSDTFPRRKLNASKDLIDMRPSLAPDEGGVK